METAEEFARELAELARVMNPWGYGEHDWHAPIVAIEARGNATRLALLDELIALDDGSEDTLPVYRAVAMLRAKYTQPVEPGQESK